MTASSGGLGRASAIALAREGANVVISGRNEWESADTKTEVEEIVSGTGVAQQGDLTEPPDIETVIKRPIDEIGGLDHLVTSAGGPQNGAFLDTTDED